ncbi:hypothetical protein DFH07DRAFT_780268 [Mycena maculata]|uniref:Uncharacterized protein n=1 Tax=Mycena maculata TaxID=230809 RepID=A0AAD7I402_9AGAR|nr:hypothetical protein DFH07DRAFT_780268 [Mycena maculata]
MANWGDNRVEGDLLAHWRTAWVAAVLPLDDRPAFEDLNDREILKSVQARDMAGLSGKKNLEEEGSGLGYMQYLTAKRDGVGGEYDRYYVCTIRPEVNFPNADKTILKDQDLAAKTKTLFTVLQKSTQIIEIQDLANSVAKTINPPVQTNEIFYGGVYNYGMICTLDNPVYLTPVKGKTVHCLDRSARPRIITFDPPEYCFIANEVDRSRGQEDVVSSAEMLGESTKSYPPSKRNKLVLEPDPLGPGASKTTPEWIVGFKKKKVD